MKKIIILAIIAMMAVSVQAQKKRLTKKEKKQQAELAIQLRQDSIDQTVEDSLAQISETKVLSDTTKKPIKPVKNVKKTPFQMPTFTIGSSVVEFLKPNLVKKTGKKVGNATELLINGKAIWFSDLKLIYGGERDSVGGKVVIDSAVCVTGVVVAAPDLASTAQIVPIPGDADPLDASSSMGWYFAIAGLILFGGGTIVLLILRKRKKIFIKKTIKT